MFVIIKRIPGVELLNKPFMLEVLSIVNAALVNIRTGSSAIQSEEVDSLLVVGF